MANTNDINKHYPEPEIHIPCPRCKKKTTAEAYEVKERWLIPWIIPYWVIKKTYVRCLSCHIEMLCKVKLEEIGKYDADQLAEFLVFERPLISIAMAITACLVCWVPFLGLIVSSIALIMNIWFKGWIRMINWIALVASLLSSIYFSFRYFDVLVSEFSHL